MKITGVLIDQRTLNASTKDVYATQLSDALIIHLDILKYIIDGISKTFNPTWVLMRKYHFGAIEWYFLGLFIMRENSLIADIIHH